MASIRLAVPETVTRGEVFEIKALIQHTMETGYRRDSRGPGDSARYHQHIPMPDE